MKKLYLTALSTLFVSLFAAATLATGAGAQGTGRDCDSNAIVNCGALTADEMKQKYNANEPGDLDNVFAHYGISSGDVAQIQNAREGTVHKDGRVVVDGKVVATNAKTVGRQDISGSKPVTIGNKTYYERTPSVSFRSDSLPAFVVLKSDGTFDYAIIKSCGNPVVATSVKPAQPPVQPKYTCDSLTARKIDRTTYRFTADTTVSGGAEVDEYRFGFGDGMGITTDEPSYSYTYKEPGTYTANVNVHFNVNGEQKVVGGEACKVTVTVDAPPVKTKPKEPAAPAAPVKPVKTEKVEKEPEELPVTGPAQVIGVGMGAGSIAAAGYYWRLSRRNLINKILNR